MLCCAVGIRVNCRVAEKAQEKSPLKYMLTVEQMIENDYPLPSYLADTFEKSEGWIETPEPSDTISSTSEGGPRILAIDCEMVCRVFSQLLIALTLLSAKVSNGSRERASASLCH